MNLGTVVPILATGKMFILTIYFMVILKVKKLQKKNRQNRV